MSGLQLTDLAHGLRGPSELRQLGAAWKEAYDALLERALAALFSDHAALEELKLALRLYADAATDFRLNPLVAHVLLHDRPLEAHDESYLKSRLLEVLSRTSDDYCGVVTTRMTCFGVPCDAGDNLLFAEMQECYGVLSSPQRGHDILSKVDHAYAKVLSVCPDAASFIAENNLLLAFRDDVSNPASYSSGSYSGYPGLTLLANASLSRISSGRIIDSLYHEAIHAVIYYFEELVHPLLSKTKSTDSFFLSPWTGNKLGANQFTQAILVWFGLLCLWGSPGVAAQFVDGGHMLRKAASGFASDPVATFLSAGGRDLVTDATAELLLLVRSGADEAWRGLRSRAEGHPTLR